MKGVHQSGYGGRDYKKEKLDAATEGGKYDKIIDIVGRHRWLFF
jgi:hypothetical protein